MLEEQSPSQYQQDKVLIVDFNGGKQRIHKALLIEELTVESDRLQAP